MKLKCSSRTLSLFIAHIGNLIASLGSAIIITGLWPYVQRVSMSKWLDFYYVKVAKNTFSKLDSSITLSQYGFVVATDAFCQMFCCPLYGFLADKIGSIRYLGMWCGFIFTVGNLTYANLYLVPKDTVTLGQARLVALIISRLLVGAGGGIQWKSISCKAC